VIRTILGILLGIVVTLVLITVCEAAGHCLWPPPGPGDVDFHNLDEARRALHVGRIPAGAMAAVVVGWVVGAFGGGWVAARVGRRGAGAYVVGGLVILASLAMLLHLPHPVWMWVTALAGLPLATCLAARLGTPKG